MGLLGAEVLSVQPSITSVAHWAVYRAMQVAMWVELVQIGEQARVVEAQVALV
jgi:hypothetical protein